MACSPTVLWHIVWLVNCINKSLHVHRQYCNICSDWSIVSTSHCMFTNSIVTYFLIGQLYQQVIACSAKYCDTFSDWSIVSTSHCMFTNSIVTYFLIGQLYQQVIACSAKYCDTFSDWSIVSTSHCMFINSIVTHHLNQQPLVDG